MSRELHEVERRRGPRPLAARMLMARLGWLDGFPVWRDGRVAWEHDGVVIPIGPAELSRAQRHLNRIREFAASATGVLGDRDAWVTERRDRLEHAKRLTRIEEPDPGRLGERAARRDPQAAARLVALLPAEAECVSGFPGSAARDLVRAGTVAEAALRRALDDPAAGLPARVLAALTLGAILRRSDVGRYSVKAGMPASVALAIRHGQLHGLTDHPAIAATLLAGQADSSLLPRQEAALRSPSLFALKPEAIRRLLAEGLPGGKAVRLAEVCANTDRLAARLLNRPHEDDPDSPFRRASTRTNRATEAAEIARIVSGLVGALRDATAVEELLTLLELLLGLCPVFPGLTAMVRRLLERVGSLPPDRIAPVIRLLGEHHQAIWEPETIASMVETARRKRKLGPLGSQLERRSALQALPLVSLAGSTGRFVEAGELFSRGWITGFGRLKWKEPWHLEAAVQITSGVIHDYPDGLASILYEFFDSLPGEVEGRAICRSLAGALAAWAPEDRRTILAGVCTTVWDFGSRARWCRALPVLLEWTPQPGHRDTLDGAPPDRIGLCLQLAASLLDEARLKEGEERVLLQSIPWRVCAGRESWTSRKNLCFGGRLAVVLAQGDPRAVGPILNDAAAHVGEEDLFEAVPGLVLLRRSPGACRAMTTLLPVQAGRCFKLLARLAHAGAAGTGAAASLFAAAMREPDPEATQTLSEDPAWSPLLPALADCDSVLGDYVSAQRVLGRGVSPPAGVVRELTLPARWQRELDYLVRRLALGVDDPDLAARAAGLRTRLAGGVRQDVQANAARRLQFAAAEAQLAAMEHLLQQWFRERLEILAGPLPAEVTLDDDLINAVLLSSNIDHNRPLLRKLMRAHFAGDRLWRERQPANATFLTGLRERGSDPTVWLGRHTHREARGPFTLWLETEPLRILQMGNYFNTCLSLGQCNAYSAVANAGDLNKRVLYVANAAGRIVGRKLLAVTSDWNFVGFRTFSSLPTRAEDVALIKAVRRFTKRFGRKCGLAMAEAGTVTPLVAKQWYDDGIVEWKEEGCGKYRSPGNSSAGG